MLNPRNWESSAVISLKLTPVTHLKSEGLGSAMLFVYQTSQPSTVVGHTAGGCYPSESKLQYTVCFMNIGPLCVAEHLHIKMPSMCLAVWKASHSTLSSFQNSLTLFHELMPVLKWLIELLSDQRHEFYGLKVGDEKIVTFLSPH